MSDECLITLQLRREFEDMSKRAYCPLHREPDYSDKERMSAFVQGMEHGYIKAHLLVKAERKRVIEEAMRLLFEEAKEFNSQYTDWYVDWITIKDILTKLEPATTSEAKLQQEDSNE